MSRPRPDGEETAAGPGTSADRRPAGRERTGAVAGPSAGSGRRRARRPLPPTARVALGILGPLLLLGAWEAYVHLADVDPILLPAPSDVAVSLVEDRALLWDAFLVTGQEVLFGLAAALVLGAGLAVLMHLSAIVRAMLGPLVIGIQAVPIPVLAPVLVFWLGFGVGPKVVIVTIICFFPVVINTLDALDRVDPDLGRLLQTMGAGRRQRLRWVELPAALPAALSGAKVAVAIAGIAAVFAEYAGAEQGSEGLGLLISSARFSLATDRAFAAVFILAVFAVLTTGALALAQRLLAPWAHRRPGAPS
ncbi:MAG: ABC transporter permease [Solirubrobacteraceae bacterium]